jgi:hypothetical protein
MDAIAPPKMCGSLLSLLLFLFGFGILGCSGPNKESDRLTYDGPSDELKATKVLPALDSPIPERNSAIWCAPFDLVCSRLADVLGEGKPIRFKDGAALPLNTDLAKSPDETLPADSYATLEIYPGGSESLGNRSLAEALEKERLADPESQEGPFYVAAILQARLRFPHSYQNGEERGMPFTDSKGIKSTVRYFGLLKGNHSGERDKAREQLRVLWCEHILPSNRSSPVERFALDLCADSEPFQIICAQVNAKPTLAAMVADLEGKIESWRPDANEEHLEDLETLGIACMHWRIKHRFREFEGPEHRIANSPIEGLYLRDASEEIEFRIDRQGVALDAKARVAPKTAMAERGGVLRDFRFTQPHLIILKKRGAKTPSFVMWVDNAEMMEKTPVVTP